MKIPEIIKRHPRISYGTLAALLVVGGLEGAGYASNPTYDVPAGACASPFAESPPYQGKDANLWFQTWGGLFTTGVVAQGTLPQGAYGVEASFEAPGADEDGWNEKVSGMLHPDADGRYDLKMAIGSGAVKFGVRVIAPEGLGLCASPPDVAFVPKTASEYFDTSAQLPWVNPGDGVINLF